MKQLTYQYLYKDIVEALRQEHLLSALQLLQGMATTLKSWSVKEETDTLLESYQILLSYMAKGVDDPERNKMYVGFRRRTYELAEVLNRVGLLMNDTTIYATSFRTLCQLYGNDYTLSDILYSQYSLRDKFDAIWLSAAWTADDELTVANYMANNAVNEIDKCLLLSATTIAAMQFFDIAKYRILIDAALSTNIKLRVRALVGVIFTHIIHSERIALYTDVNTRLELMCDLPRFSKEIEHLQMQLFLSLETKRIERNLQEEIIPQMMKRIEKLNIDTNTGLDELNEKLSEEDFNPEWSDNAQDKKLNDYMHEFVELQQRGADMYMGSFKIMKQRFPFFNTVSNWFWPFTLNHPEVPESARESRLTRLMINNVGLCDSDKYSLCMMSTHIPSQLKNDKFQESMLERLEEVQPNHETDAETLFKNELRSYVQGFYRFCNLFLHHEQFTNPFQHDLFIVNYAPFDKMLRDDSFLLRMINFVFKDQSYALANKLFEQLSPNNYDAEVLQKWGICNEHEGNIRKAIECYKQSDLLKGHSQWTLKRLAHCYSQMGEYVKALTYYDQLAEQNNEDVSIALKQAECHIHLKQYEEAFKYLFKADYLAPKTRVTERAIAWCSLLTQKYSQAEKYYTKVLDDNPTPTDYFNAGHSAWLSGNIAEAISRYRKAIADNPDIAFLNNDKDLLHAANKSDEDIAMITDAVLSNL